MLSPATQPSCPPAFRAPHLRAARLCITGLLVTRQWQSLHRGCASVTNVPSIRETEHTACKMGRQGGGGSRQSRAACREATGWQSRAQRTSDQTAHTHRKLVDSKTDLLEQKKNRPSHLLFTSGSLRRLRTEPEHQQRGWEVARTRSPSGVEGGGLQVSKRAGQQLPCSAGGLLREGRRPEPLREFQSVQVQGGQRSQLPPIALPALPPLLPRDSPEAASPTRVGTQVCRAHAGRQHHSDELCPPAPRLMQLQPPRQHI